MLDLTNVQTALVAMIVVCVVLIFGIIWYTMRALERPYEEDRHESDRF